jgi:hypothetical protein
MMELRIRASALALFLILPAAPLVAQIPDTTAAAAMSTWRCVVVHDAVRADSGASKTAEIKETIAMSLERRLKDAGVLCPTVEPVVSNPGGTFDLTARDEYWARFDASPIAYLHIMITVYIEIWEQEPGFGDLVAIRQREIKSKRSGETWSDAPEVFHWARGIQLTSYANLATAIENRVLAEFPKR